MIIDADSHLVPLELFENFPDVSYVKKLKRYQSMENFDQRWEQLYNNVKDDSWPACGKISEFGSLPLNIRKELRDIHQLDQVYISNDYLELHVDSMHVAPTSFVHQKNSALHLCKVTRQLINPASRPMHMIYQTDKKLAVNIMQTWNAGMQKVCSQDSFFDYTLWLAIQDIDASVRELQQYSNKDFFAVYLDENMPWAWTKNTLPIFEFCSSHKIPIYFHVSSMDDPPLFWDWNHNDRFTIQSKQWNKILLADYTNCWQINICGLITEGILDRYPEIRIVVAENGIGWLRPMQTFMLEQGWPDPLPYFKKNFWFTTEVEDPNFIEDANWVGWDRILFSTDYPHNDAGGNNRYKDVDTINLFLNRQLITLEQYKLLTHENYLFLKSRK